MNQVKRPLHERKNKPNGNENLRLPVPALGGVLPRHARRDDCTQGTIDFTVPDEVPAGTYRLEVRSRAGEGLNRTLVTASIGEFAIKAA